MSVELTDSLLSLSQIVIEECNKLKTNGVIKQKIPYVKFTVDFEYESGRMTTLSQTTEETVIEQFGLYNREIAHLPQTVLARMDIDKFSECIDLISKLQGVPQHEAVGLIHTFINSLAFHILENGDAPDVFLREFISTFIYRLDKEPDWKIKIWLSGVWVDEHQLELVEGVILKQPHPSDFERVIPLDHLSHLSMHYSDIEYMNVMSVLEISISAAPLRQVDKEIINFENLLMLFRLGQIKRLKHTLTPNRSTGSMFGTSITSFGYTSANPSYEVKQGDIEIFGQYYTQVKPHLDELTKQDEFIGIAYHRYKDALFEGLAEGRIASAINCLEALYLGVNQGELAHRLSQRVAVVLRQKISVSGLDIYEKMKEAYDIRSAFVHGAVASKKSRNSERRKSIRELSKTILDYARNSLLIFLHLRTLKNKEDFLKLIDNSLLDDAAQQELVGLIRYIVVT